MAFDPGLAERLSALCADWPGAEETRMFGGFGYLLNGNLCVGIYKDMLVVRVGTETARALMAEDHVRPFDITGKVMKAWAMIEPAGLADDAELARYVGLAHDFVYGLPAKR